MPSIWKIPCVFFSEKHRVSQIFLTKIILQKSSWFKIKNLYHDLIWCSEYLKGSSVNFCKSWTVTFINIWLITFLSFCICLIKLEWCVRSSVICLVSYSTHMTRCSFNVQCSKCSGTVACYGGGGHWGDVSPSGKLRGIPHPGNLKEGPPW